MSPRPAKVTRLVVPIDEIVHDLRKVEDHLHRTDRSGAMTCKIRYRWECSCGWRSTLRDRPDLTWPTVRQHVVPGQTSLTLQA